jgi:hypothetical protein
MTGDAEGYRLYTIDHETGQERLDLEHMWADAAAPQPIRYEDDLLCDPFEVRGHVLRRHGIY